MGYFFSIQQKPPFGGFCVGATAGGRTQDLGLKRPLLYQLSYRRKIFLLTLHECEDDKKTRADCQPVFFNSPKNFIAWLEWSVLILLMGQRR